MTETSDKDKNKDNDRSVLSHIVDAVGRKSRDRASSTFGGEDFRLYRGSGISVASLEIMTIVLGTGELNNLRDGNPHLYEVERIELFSIGKNSAKEEAGTQRVYKKTSPNSLLTLYLPTRELLSCGSIPAVIKGIVFVDPKLIQGHRIYAQLTLTFRYGREDEEVMGLRFCNEAIMSLHQVWPRSEEIVKEVSTPLQEALIKRLGDGAHPFTLSLTPQAPPSVQLVPAKRYYGAPIGTSYDIRCFIADKSDEKFHRRATVKMGVRVIHRTDVFSSIGPENFATLVNSQSPPPHDSLTQGGGGGGGGGAIESSSRNPSGSQSGTPSLVSAPAKLNTLENVNPGHITTTTSNQTKSRKSERMDSFPKIRLSPKAFRFSSRFGRSKSEVEKGPSDPFYSYSKSFQEYDYSGGPQGAVDKPFLLQEGRVGLRANLDKSWYTHGEDVIVTVNIKNDSRKTVRRMRVCAIQHVDVCMFNNGKFKNIVADSDTGTPTERIVGPGSSLNATFILKPQRGPTKNWIALEDSLQRSSEPDEITGSIAASAVKTSAASSSSPEDRNVFAIYVSYYVKVKLTLSGMGGELSLKLPFALVHIDPQSKNLANAKNAIQNQSMTESVNKLTLSDPAPGRAINKISVSEQDSHQITTSVQVEPSPRDVLDKIESLDDDTPVQIPQNNLSKGKRKLVRHSTVKEHSSDEDIKDDIIVSDSIVGAIPSTTTTVSSAAETPSSATSENNISKLQTDSGNPTDENDGQLPKDNNDKAKESDNSCHQTTCAQVHATSL